jgi:hypothetical protein
VRGAQGRGGGAGPEEGTGLVDPGVLEILLDGRIWVACLARPIERKPALDLPWQGFTPEVLLLVPLQLGIARWSSAVLNGGCDIAQRASEWLKGSQRTTAGHLLSFWCGVRAPGGPRQRGRSSSGEAASHPKQATDLSHAQRPRHKFAQRVGSGSRALAGAWLASSWSARCAAVASPWATDELNGSLAHSRGFLWAVGGGRQEDVTDSRSGRDSPRWGDLTDSAAAYGRLSREVGRVVGGRL